MIKITEEILELIKETIIQLEQRGRKNTAALVMLRKTIDHQLRYVQGIKSVIKP